MKHIKLLGFFLFVLFVNNACTQSALETYFNTQSLRWEQLPYQWNEGAFTGNGEVGMMFFVDSLDNSLTFWLGRPDVTDHRKSPDRKTSLGVPGASVMSDYNRLDIGKMKIHPDGEIIDGNIELNIFNAEIRGEVQTSNGTFRFLAYTPRNNDINIIEVNYNGNYKFEYIPGKPCTPRYICFPQQRGEYLNNPDPVITKVDDGEGGCRYDLNAGGDYAVYWKQVKKNKEQSYIYVSAVNEVPKSGVSFKKAKENVISVSNDDIDAVKENMHQWWHKYWDKSYINIPDKQIENFYNIQMYKLAVNSSPDGPAMDCLGVLYKTTQWPGVWWNLNVQLTYMSTLITNRDEQSENYIKLLDSSFYDILQAQKTAKVGDYAWALHTYYSILKYRGEKWEVIKDKFLPKAMAVIEKYKPALVMKDGVYHLLKTESPEYEKFDTYDNSNYNLALLRWLITAINETCENCNSHIDEVDSLNFIKDKLHPTPVDSNGLMIASNKPFAKSHRHYSHLLSFYPLKIQDMQNDSINNLLKKSLDHWFNIGKGKALAGYSFTGAASLYALLGDGDKSYEIMKRFLNGPIGISLLLPNTMYVESRGKNPVIETPLSAATAISEMLLQTVNGIIVPFPAIPDKWEDCSFKNLRAEGGVEVSAEMKNSRLTKVSLNSKSGGKFKVKLKGWENVYCLNNNDVMIERIQNDLYLIDFKGNDGVLLSDDKNCEGAFDYPIGADKSYYGVKKGKGLPYQMNWD